MLGYVYVPAKDVPMVLEHGYMSPRAQFEHDGNARRLEAKYGAPMARAEQLFAPLRELTRRQRGRAAKILAYLEWCGAADAVHFLFHPVPAGVLPLFNLRRDNALAGATLLCFDVPGEPRVLEDIEEASAREYAAEDDFYWELTIEAALGRGADACFERIPHGSIKVDRVKISLC